MAKFQDTYRLTVGNFDCLDHVLISTILDVFQDIAGKNASSYGYGYEELLAMDKVWMVLRTKYKVIKPIPEYENIIVRTWTNEPSKIDIYRHYEILDKDENLLVQGSSQWVVVDLKSRRLIKILDIPQDINVILPDMPFGVRLKKIDDFDLSLATKVDCKTNYLDLDHNGHVNNIKYGDFIMNNIKELHNQTIDEFQIDYVHELSKDEDFSLYYVTDNKEINVIGRNDEKIFFIAKVLLKSYDI